MIEELSNEQKKLLDQVCAEWLAHGLSTEPANRAEAERGVREAYAAAGLRKPGQIIWCDSPIEGCREARRLIKDSGGQICYELVRNQVLDQVLDQVWDQVEDQVWNQMLNQVRQVWDQVLYQVLNQARGRVWSQVWDQVQDEVWSQILGQFSGGQHDADWLAMLDFWSRVLPGLPDVSGLLRIGRSAGWWWPLGNTVILTERRSTLHLDAQGRLHCEDGPAVAYPDGWGVYAWRGTQMPEDLITEGWDVQRILSEPNLEVRRCAIERMGWGEFVREAGLKQVGRAQPDPGNLGQILALYDVPPEIYGGDQHVRVLLCRNATLERDGTRRRYGLTVPADISSPLAAAAWSFGLPPVEYQKMDRAS